MIVGIVFLLSGGSVLFMSRVLDGYPSNYNISGFCVEYTFAIKVHNILFSNSYCSWLISTILQINGSHTCSNDKP